MGRVVDFAELAADDGGVVVAAIAEGETQEFAAAFVRVGPGERWTRAAPQGSDCYIFNLNGAGVLAVDGMRHPLPVQAFATIEEGTGFAVANEGGTALELIEVVAPPRANGRGLAGFKGKASVAQREQAPVVPVPEQHKTRLYFVGGDAARSERGHAMIVIYDGETHTPLHHHPNADSLFVLLDGAVQFTVGGEQVVVKPGQAAVFPAMDRHGLHTAPGYAGASFLEFHIPAAFTTVRE